MPLTTQDEILFAYASLIQPELIKTAWDFKDLLKTFGLDALIGAGSGGAALAGGASVGEAGAAALGIAGGPITAIVLGVLAIGGLAMGIYQLSKLTDDNLAGLLKRLEALDPDTQAKPIVDGWLKAIEAYKKQLDAASLITGTDEERAAKTLMELNIVQSIVTYLKTIQRDWPEIKKHLKDWEIIGDPAHAEKAINQTTTVLESESQKLIQQLQANAQKVVQEYSQKSGQNYIQAAKEITELYDRLTELNGKALILDLAENEAWILTQQILGKTGGEPVTADELQKEWSSITTLKTTLQQAIEYLSKHPAKAESIKPPISKRALTLADGKHFGPTKQKAQNQTITTIQIVLNAIMKSYPQQFEGKATLTADGIYGPLTADALNALVTKMGAEEHLGLTSEEILDYKDINADIEKQNKIYQMFVALEKEIGGKATPAQTPAPKPVGECPWGKDNMTDNEIESCLRAIVVQEEGRERMAASDWLELYNYSTPKERADVVRRQLSSADGSLGGNWTDKTQQLIWDVKQAHSTQPGQGQFDFGRI